MIKWDLSETRNQQVRLEVVDGDNGPSYAWLAITRLEPGVADVKTFGPSAAHQELLGPCPAASGQRTR